MALLARGQVATSTGDWAGCMAANTMYSTCAGPARSGPARSDLVTVTASLGQKPAAQPGTAGPGLAKGTFVPRGPALHTMVVGTQHGRLGRPLAHLLHPPTLKVVGLRASVHGRHRQVKTWASSCLDRRARPIAETFSGSNGWVVKVVCCSCSVHGMWVQYAAVEQ